MPQPILTAAAMRDAETAAVAAGTTYAALMATAGKAVADTAARFALGRPILVLAGPGNNGGDGYVAASILAERGHDVIVAAHGDARSAEAIAARAAWQGQTIALADAEPRPILIDALFGTGLSRPLDADVATTLQSLVDAAEFSLAVDVPSGVDTDTGADLGAPHGLTATLALGAYKPAHLIEPAAGLCGHLFLADIGVPARGSWHVIARPQLVPPPRDAQKFTRGLVVVVAGAMPGAARLAARAAIHAGAGYVILAGADAGQPEAIVHKPLGDPADLAAILDDDRIGCVLIGPGLGRDDRASALLDIAVASRHPLVVDGDALTLLGREAPHRLAPRADIAMTPHAGEFARMFASADGKLLATLSAARAIDGVVVHKGPDTVVAAPDGRAAVQIERSSWLSTAGSGDTLAGILAARRATGVDFFGAAQQAVWFHTRAAKLAGPAFVADQLSHYLPAAIGECL
ncbi:hydroxyethylthiazole kinase-like uncharacterized protein yjeF [Sphingomonas jinjuensis]|uniref:Bifunctional NAD(P)H-hydrate repair enzyme n=1 Tax=Sphingomonas jinjuensis TaxID=535907 RepID=A0A840FLB3_9SPHN|nr:NAD(P)H-hydrate epimerase [Sphingomonas jinjuensis]MBB4154105.1 hydroxyethylthiazole kinase-like uncharacterized protein yjeF [Sphingomonas jinjuensis]